MRKQPVPETSTTLLTQHGVLNPALFGKMRTRFGKVKITNAGMANAEQGVLDAYTGRNRLTIAGFGETYSVNCPFCADSRQRLSVNYTYGTLGSQYTGELRDFIWRCYNEECQRKQANRKQLAEWLIWTSGRMTPMEVHEGVAVPQGTLTPCNLPGRCTHARYLPPTHPMIAYFAGRKEGPVLASTLIAYDIHYCADAPLKGAVGRAIIPLQFEGELVGWQGRYLGDVDWKATGIQKYYNLPGFMKTLMLYNYDAAAAIQDRPYVVVTEGITSAWAVGQRAVALFGKTMSHRQMQLLTTTWAHRPIFVYLDGSAEEESKKLMAALALHTGPVVNVRLPAGRDPGNLDQVANLGMLRGAASRHAEPFSI